MISPNAILLAHAGEMLLLVSPQSLEIVAASPSCTQLGYPPGALIGRPITDVECSLSDMFFWEEVRNGGTISQDETQSLYQTADGGMLAVRKQIRVDDSGAIVIRARDISAELRAEDAQAELASHLRATLEATADGILLVDTRQGILNMNRRFAQLWQVPDALLQRRDDARLFAWLAGQCADAQQWQESFEVSDPHAEHFADLDLRDGRVFEIKSRPAMRGEQLIGRVFCVTDATAYRQAERQLIEARDEAAAASRAKGEFLAMMSHEIRTPMNGVIGMAQLLATTRLNAEQREQVNTIVSSGEALLAVINDILDYSKIEARKLTLEHTDFSLGELLRDIERLFSIPAREKQLVLQIDMAADLPDLLHGDPTRLRQILFNLIGNALKFTDTGTVSVCVRQQALDVSSMRLHVTVRDSGIGIPGERIASIFHPFEQADMSTTRRYGGTGLGLSICRMLCEMMGGEIGVRSQLGEGSEFWFTVRLDLAHTKATDHRPAQDMPVLPSDCRMLIVEDNLVNQKVLLRLLEKLGDASCQLAISGEAALAACAATPFDLIFMDARMPGMDGLQTTTALRGAGSRAHIIGVSADAYEDDRARALAAGMDDYLAKPVALQALRAALLRWQATRA